MDVNELSDEQFLELLRRASERIDGWDRPHPYVELAQWAMEAAAIAAHSPVSGYASELPAVLEGLKKAIENLED